ncbi:MAG: glycosyltransferase family 39 protein, partial [Phycisphaerae bacterium]
MAAHQSTILDQAVAPPRRRAPWTACVASSRRPRWLLAAVVLAAYWPSLGQVFLLDDYRNLQCFAEYQDGTRDHLGLYEFVQSPDEVRRQRKNGDLPWWVSDNLRFAYFRPLSERFLWAQYQIFGQHPLGYRLVSLGLYVLGLWLVLSLYRQWIQDETVARWAAVLFAVASCNAIPVAFVASQCDLLALIACLSTLLCITRFARGGSPGWLVLAMPIYSAGLLSKEASIAAALLPLGLLWIAGRSQSFGRPCVSTRRVFLATALLTVMALGFTYYHASGGYGSNGALMLHPIHDPLSYLTRMPFRVLMLLTSWLIPINPLATYLNNEQWLLPLAYAAAGAAGLACVGTLIWRRFGQLPPIRAFTFWGLIFLPLLACTCPDNRVMMLPMVGLSALAAVWLCGGLPAYPMRDHPGDDAPETQRPIQRLPLVL